MFGHLRDPGLPVLETLGPADLDRIAGAAGVRLLRLRHRSGERPIMHVAWGAAQVAGQGAIWIYPGDKTQRLARRIPGARLDAASGALFQAFPQDHRMPLLAAFLRIRTAHLRARQGQTCKMCPQSRVGPATASS